jgi:5'-phosphate synthase pdxT subunit
VGADPNLRIGVLALQGDVTEHVAAFDRALEERTDRHPAVILVRRAEQIVGLDGLAIPGGESTTISRLIDRGDLRDAITSFNGGIFATCAGMVLVAETIDDPRVSPLRIVAIHVDRNAFGRQKESFEIDLDIDGLDSPFHAVFIRAPVATSIGPGAESLASLDQGSVAIRQGRHMALSFHPELGPDLRLHHLFLDGL